jgi:hypothetical protein
MLISTTARGPYGTNRIKLRKFNIVDISYINLYERFCMTRVFRLVLGSIGGILDFIDDAEAHQSNAKPRSVHVNIGRIELSLLL